MKGALDFIKTVYDTFGFSLRLYLSTRPEKFLGDLEMWNDAEKVCFYLNRNLLRHKVAVVLRQPNSCCVKISHVILHQLIKPFRFY